MKLLFDFRLNKVILKIPRYVPSHSCGGSGALGGAGSSKRAGSWWDGGGSLTRDLYILGCFS